MNFHNFVSQLNEKYLNLFSTDRNEREKYVDEVFAMLKKSYEKIGGIGGSGFRSPQDMIDNIPFWKLAFSGRKLVACVMYKDKSGRKLVAIGSTGTSDAKKYVRNILEVEFTRSYSEISGPLLKYMEKRFPEVIVKYLISPTDVSKLIDKKINIIDNKFYSRNIGGEEHKKLALGTINRKLY